MFKVAGPLWAQATAGGNNVFERLVKTGKKVLRRVFQNREVEPTAGREIPKPTWSLRAQAVQISDTSSKRLIGGLFPKEILKTQAAEVRRQAALRLIRDSRKVPVFAFVGLSMGVGLGTNGDQKRESDDVLCSGIKGLFQQYGVKEGTVTERGQRFSLETLQLGQLIGKGCNAAVYEARPANTSCEEESAVPSAGSTQQEDVDQDAPMAGDQKQHCVAGSGSSVDVTEEIPPVLFHTDDHVASDCEEEDEDFIIISDNEEDSEGAKLNTGRVGVDMDGWVLYRVSSASTAPDSTSADRHVTDTTDSDSDIIILAAEGTGLETVPDLEDLDLGWSVVQRSGSDDATVSDISSESAVSSGQSSVSSVSASDTSLTSESSLTSGATDDLEPAPNLAPGTKGDYPLAVKMMFNYGVESQADRILTAMAKETVPAQCSADPSAREAGSSQQAGLKKLPPHPNIVEMVDVFVDQTPELPDAMRAYPSALPERLNKDGGCGRNATMFLVMKKYTMTLREYLAEHNADTRTRCLIFAQLLEGLAHLGHHGIAHRDLKSDNILLDLSHGKDFPSLAISDFGCCLADGEYGLKLPYLTREMDRGGNGALMAPEIKCAEPGRTSILDYSRADLWAAGALAYEIFGEGNPFYSQLDARTYTEDDLPRFAADVPTPVVKLVEALLKRDPAQRPSPAVAATIVQLSLWAPADLLPFARPRPIGYSPLWRRKELCHWLEQLIMETVCRRVFEGGAAGPSALVDLRVKTTFLSRVTLEDISAVVTFD